MPLLRKQPFIREQPSPDLTPDSEVFFCRITKEIFTDYESFFERIILCNSLVWSCAITGKSGLTYQEAIECEEKAKRNLSSFPSSIQKPILYLATKTHRTRLNDLNDDIFGFVKERFFLGEVVDVVINDVRRTCEVIKIIPPPPAENKNGDIIVIDDDDDESVKPQALQEPVKYKYVVKEKKGGAMSTVRCTVISRKKSVYTRDKNKLYLKLHCEPVDGVWKVKDESKAKFKLNSCKFDQFYAGPVPSFQVSSQKKKAASKKSDGKPSTDGSASKKSKSKDKKTESVKHNPFIPDYGVDQETLLKMTAEERTAQREKVKQERLEEKERKKEEIRKKNEEIRNKKREEKAKEREEQRKEKFKQLEILREYNRIREDIELDDLKLMPEFTPVSTRLPTELFGEAMHILEFTHCFKTMFDFKQFFPKGFTYGMLESAILDNDTDGPLCDLLQMLLVSIFTLQEEEAEEVAELETDTSIRDDDQDESLTNQLIEQATMIAQTPQQVHGLPLKKMLLDQFTLSEILRLHLMSAGCKTTIRNARFRYQQRGGYTSQDDAGLDFKITDMNLLRSLNSKNVYDLQPEEKLKIISVLLQQILSYAAIRDLIDESFDKIRTLKYDLKQLQWAEQRREREDAAARYKKQQEDKMKERMKRMKLLMEQNPKANIEGAMKDQNENKMEVDDEDDELTAEEKEAQERKYQEKEARKKLEFARKEEEALTTIMELQQNIATYPLGRDRMFRRYWLFKSMNGIFVEDNSLFVDEENLFSYKSQSLVSDADKNNTSSDKENDLCLDDKGDNCIVISDDESRSNDSKEQFMQIPDTPAILQIKERVKYPWSFVSPGCLDKLLDVLNPRGFRESSLKQTITEIKPLVVNSLDRCETEELCQSGVDTEEARIKALALTRGIASKKAAQDTLKRDSADVDLELNLRDAILDIEDRMFVGALGYLKVEDRTVWRTRIESNAPGNLVNGSNSGDATEENERDSVKELAQALLEISGGIDHRYLQLPLKESDGKKKGGKGDKKKKKKEEEVKDGEESDDNKDEEKKKITTFDKWQESLKHVTSLSQVYLHLSTFEKSVMWDKSALHARCRLCRKKGDAERMLLCDGCDRGHHMDCLKPPIKKVPVGDWYCPNCRPKEVIIRSPRKGRRRTFSDEVEEVDEGSSQEEEVEEEEGEEEEASSDVDEDSEAEEEEEEEEADESMEDDNENTCSVCNTPGMLICCDCCPKSYHLACAIPALKKIPRGKWLCQECLGINKVGKVKFGQKQKAKRSSKSNLAVLARNSPKHSPASTPRSSTKGDSDDDTPVRSSKSRKTTPRTTEKEDYSAKKTKSGSRGNAKIQHLKMAEELIADLIKHDDAWPFLKPVNRREVPDYYDVIKEPMDFQTIKNKIHKFEYGDPSQIIEDVRLIFNNCVEYNNRNTPQYKSGTILNKYFQKRVKEMALDVDDYVPPPSKKSRH